MNDLRKLLYSYKHLASSCLIILLSALGMFLGGWSAIKRVLLIQENNKILVKQNENLRKKITILDAIDIDLYKKVLSELLRAVPADQSLVTIFSTIDGLGTATGVTVKNFTLSSVGDIASDSAKTLSADEQKMGSTVLDFNVNLIGSYEQIRDYLFRVSQVRRVLRVLSFDISLADVSTISVNMKMNAFFMPYKTSLGAADAPIEPLNQKDNDTISIITNMPVVAGANSAIQIDSQANPTVENKENVFEP